MVDMCYPSPEYPSPSLYWPAKSLSEVAAFVAPPIVVFCILRRYSCIIDGVPVRLVRLRQCGASEIIVPHLRYDSLDIAETGC